MLVWLLQHQKQVRIERLAAALPLPIQQNSRRRHLQRFLTLDALSVVLLWFPILEEIFSRQVKTGAQLIIALDRTQWEPMPKKMGQACFGITRYVAEDMGDEACPIFF